MANHLFDALAGGGRELAPALHTETETLTHASLWRAVGRWAAALGALGVRPGERVVARVEKSAANLILYLATVRAGGVYVPLNPAYTDAELAFFLADAEPAAVVCDPAAEGAVRALASVPSDRGHPRPRAGADREVRAPTPAPRVVTLDGRGKGSLADLAAAAAADAPPAPRAPDDLAAIFYTSGTTGRPKGAMLTHAQPRQQRRGARRPVALHRDDVLIHALPIFHVHGLFVAAQRAADGRRRR